MGCVLYHALAGHPPFPDDSLVRVILRHASQPPVPLLEANPAVPADLAGVVHALLAKAPEQRYQSASEAAAALQRCLKGRP